MSTQSMLVRAWCKGPNTLRWVRVMQIQIAITPLHHILFADCARRLDAHRRTDV